MDASIVDKDLIERINKMNNNRLYVVADAETVILQFFLLSSIQ